MKPTTILHSYHFQPDKQDYARFAKVIFEDFHFDHCEYQLPHQTYDLKDWEFLNKLSGFILELVEQEKLKAKEV